MPPTFPALAGSAVCKGDVKAQVNLMLNGKGMMPGFGRTLSATDFAGVATYVRNSFGNSSEDLVQPADIQKLQAALPPEQDDDE
jgi:cytochrome c oxidase subunit 2